MGMTFCNLHLYRIDRQAVVDAMGDGDILREINPPWLAVLPQEDGTDEGASRLLRMAKNLTKGNSGAIALHFYYFDDESFHIRVCREGRCVKTLSDDHSWAFLAGQLAATEGDDRLAKAFRYKNLCLNLKERLELLEKTVGTAFYDGPWAAPRRAARDNAMAVRLRQRASLLKRLRNRYELIPIPVEKWPEYARACSELASNLPRTFEDNYHNALEDPYFRRFTVPYQPWRVAMIEWAHDEKRRLTLYDSREKRIRRIVTKEKIERTLWVDRGGRPVLIAFGQDGLGLKRVVCLDASGEVAWSFAPPLDRFQSLSWTNPTPDGMLTIQCDEPESAHQRIWQLDGETGRIVRETDSPWKTLYRVDALGGYAAVNEHGLALLNDDLTPRVEWTAEAPMRPEYSFVSGRTLWMPFMKNGTLYGFDLACGELRAVQPELPVNLEAVLPDGTLAAVGMNTDLLLLDAVGRLASRHALEGWRLYSLPDGTPCVVESVGFPKNARFTQEVMDRLALRAWAVSKV